MNAQNFLKGKPIYCSMSIKNYYMYNYRHKKRWWPATIHIRTLIIPSFVSGAPYPCLASKCSDQGYYCRKLTHNAFVLVKMILKCQVDNYKSKKNINVYPRMNTGEICMKCFFLCKSSTLRCIKPGIYKIQLLLEQSSGNCTILQNIIFHT